MNPTKFKIVRCQNVAPAACPWTHLASQALAPTVQQIADSLTTVPVVHADGTGFRVEGSLHWLHAVVSEKLAWYGVHKRRGMEAIEAQGILPKRVAVLIHDCWAHTGGWIASMRCAVPTCCVN